MNENETTPVHRYAHVLEDGTVWGVSLWDGVTPYKPPEGHTLHKLDDDSPVGPGWTLTGQTFNPPPPEPEEALDE
jgi:hypothetical protein